MLRQQGHLRSANRVGPFPLWPSFDEAEISAVVAVLRSGKVNRWTGEQNEEFEREFAAFSGCQYAVAVANGTVALELALLALGIGPGDEVIVGSRTFIASASAIVMRGAIPIFADIEPDSQNISVATVEPLITPKTRAIIAVHLAGWPCDMDPLLELARCHNIKVVEDCAQALGASYKGRPVGSLADAAAFSFCQDKIMTTGGEGGMLTTNCPAVWHKAWSYKDHGKDYQTVFGQSHKPGFRWLHHSFGTNWRMTEMQAAIGRAALPKVHDWVKTRRRHAAVLSQSFQKLEGLRVVEPPPGFAHAYYKYYCFMRPKGFVAGMTRDRLMTKISAAGIPCTSGSCSEIYLEEAVIRSGLNPLARLPVARALGETSLMFLVHPTLSADNIDTTCAVVEGMMAMATKNDYKSISFGLHPCHNQKC